MGSVPYSAEQFKTMQFQKMHFEEINQEAAFTVEFIQNELQMDLFTAVQLFKDLKKNESIVDNYPDYTFRKKFVKDANNKEIKFHDVIRTSSGEILLVELGIDKTEHIKGLVATNKYNGLHDWLERYQDDELIILGNVDYLAP